MNRCAAWCGAIALALVNGCAQYKQGHGFSDVQNAVAERTGMRVHWNVNAPEDKEVETAVNGLLAKELGADEAVQIALLNNRRLQATYEDLSIAQAELVKAGLLKNPVFRGEFRLGFDGGNAVALDVAQDFISILYLPLRKSRAESAFEASKARVTGEILDLASEVRRTYFDHVASVQELDLMRNVEESTAASTDLSERLRAAGNVRALDVSGEQALHEESIVGSNRAAAKVIRTREHMNALMGLAGAQTAWTAPSRLPVVPDAVEGAQDAEARAIASSLDLEIERRRVEIAAKSLGITQPFPWLHEGEVGIAAGKDLDTGWAMGPSLSIPIPIFDNGEADTQAAKAELRRAYDRQAALASEIRAAARAAVGELGAAHARVARYQEKILPLRQRIVDESQLQYNAMQISAFQLLQAKRDQISAGSDYVGSIREYWIARCELERILQGRVSGFKGMELGENNARGAMSAAERGQ